MRNRLIYLVLLILIALCFSCSSHQKKNTRDNVDDTSNLKELANEPSWWKNPTFDDSLYYFFGKGESKNIKLANDISLQNAKMDLLSFVESTRTDDVPMEQTVIISKILNYMKEIRISCRATSYYKEKYICYTRIEVDIQTFKCFIK